MDTIRFLHFSDLHISSESVSNNLGITKCIIEDLKKIREHNGLFDAVFFSGDLIFSGEDDGLLYELAKSTFIDPILEELKISHNRFYCCQGNHENDFSSFDEIIFNGLNLKLKSFTESNDLWNKKTIYKYLPKGVELFNSAFKKINQNVIYLSELTYYSKQTIKNCDLGICVFNTAWNSNCDSVYDYGNLIIGYQEIQKAFDNISECDIKIAMFHHPIEYLVEHDRIECEKILNRFDIILTGHIHNLNEFQKFSAVTNTLNLSAGRLDSYEPELTGYSIIELNPFNKKVKTIFRKYYRKRNTFDKAIDMAKNGENEYELSTNNLELKCAYDMSSEFSEKYTLLLKEKLISSLFTVSDKAEIIEPTVKNYSEFLMLNQDIHDAEKDQISISELLADEKNYIIFGRSNYGKTIALKYFATRYCNEFNKMERFPILIDIEKNDLAGKNQLYRAIKKFSIKNFEIDSDSKNIDILLKSQYCVILIDNIDMLCAKHIDVVNDFLRQYPLIKCIVTIKEEDFEYYKLQPMLIKLNGFEEMYLHPTNKNVLFSYASSYFEETTSAIVTDKISKTMKDLGMSKTPFNAIILFHIFNEDLSFSTISEANVVERFMEMILEKINILENNVATFDFKNKEDYLTLIAEKMFDNDRYFLYESEFEELTKSFFEPSGLDFEASGFGMVFFEKKVLTNRDKEISFTYQFMLEYYVAKSFVKNGIPDDLFVDYKFLNFSNELNYYSSILRKRDRIFDVVQSALKNEIDQFSTILQDATYKLDFDLDYKLPKDSLSIEDKNKLTDVPDLSLSYVPSSINKSQVYDTEKDFIFIKLFTLYARLVRNIDYLKVDVKKLAVEYCMDACWIILCLLNSILEDTLNEKREELTDILSKHNTSTDPNLVLNNFVNALKLSLPIAIECSLYDNIGNSKLIPIFKSISNSNYYTDIKELFFIMLYLDLGTNNSFEVIKKYIKSKNDKTMLNLLYAKLTTTYLITNSNYAEKHIQDLIFAIVKKQNPTRREHGSQTIVDKEKVIEALKRLKINKVD